MIDSKTRPFKKSIIVPTTYSCDKYLKYASLITFTLQNVMMSLSTRYAKTRAGDKFFNSTAVLMAEVIKFGICLILVYYGEGQRNMKKFLKALHKTILENPMDTLKVCVPSMAYIVQNTLFYVSATHLDAATNQVTYQLKILTTALFAMLILKKKLGMIQWASLIILIVGVILVQMANTSVPVANLEDTENRLVGFMAALGVCLISGFAGIYFEKILKESDISVWMRNLQLSFLSIPFGVFSCFVGDAARIYQKGFFFGYDYFIWYLVCFQAAGGLIVAAVIKYADNILKCFAASLAILITCIASIVIFNFKLTLDFSLGAILVIISIFLYSYKPTATEINHRPTVIIETKPKEEKLIENV